MNDSMGQCLTCGQTVQGYDLVTTPPVGSTLLGPPAGQHGELDDRSSIVTLIPCGCHILGDANATIARLLAAVVNG